MNKTQVTKAVVAGFGAALASVYAIPEAHATIMPITFRFSSVAAVAGNGSGVSQRLYTAATPSLEAATFRQFNNANPSQGKLIWAFSATSNLDTHLASMSPSSSLSPSTFTGAFVVHHSPSATGTAYIGFKNTLGNVGWFEVDWGGSGGAIKYIKGAYANAGESIVVGQLSASVPEPSELGLFALGLLALGASGVRLRREARKAAELN